MVIMRPRLPLRWRRRNSLISEREKLIAESMAVRRRIIEGLRKGTGMLGQLLASSQTLDEISDKRIMELARDFRGLGKKTEKSIIAQEKIIARLENINSELARRRKKLN